MNKQGIPSLKELFCGVVIDPMAKGANRHLKVAAGPTGMLNGGARLFLELTTVPVPADADDSDDDDDDDDGEGVCAYCELPVDECECELGDDDDDDEPEDPCEKYPKGCGSCQEYACPGGEGEDDGDDDDGEMERLVVKIQRGNGSWKELTEKEIEKSPALCRFLSAVNDYHGF